MSAETWTGAVDDRPERPTSSRGRLTVIAEAAPRPQRPRAPLTPAGAEVDESGPARATHRGPLVAVCGLGGGAGASTLAWLIASAEQRRRAAGAVLVADTGGPGSRLAAYAGAQAPRSLTDAGELAAAGQPVGQLVVTGAGGVRVLACGPRFSIDCSAEGVSLLLDAAREHYALSVIDCGTLAREADQLALSKATHVAWVLSATPSAARAADELLEHIHPYLLGVEVIVARHEPSGPKAPMRDLRRLAHKRDAPLVLMPAVGDLTDVTTDEALEIGQVSLEAIHGAFER